MILDDKEKLVKLFVENVMWGNVKLDWSRKAEELVMLRKVSENIVRWAVFYNMKQHKTEEFQNLTSDLFSNFLSGRPVAMILGELRDRDNEVELQILREENKKLKIDNIKLANELSQSQTKISELTQTPPMKKDFKGFS